MAKKDHHSEPFDEGTLLKLSLYKEYLKSWLPVFIYSDFAKEICIYDFFCGPGTDITGKQGSPLITVGVVNEFNEQLRHKSKIVRLFLNDDKQDKIDNLNTLIDGFAKPSQLYTYITCSTFEEMFSRHLSAMNNQHTCNLLFIDPCGIAVTNKIFLNIVKLNLTDFLLFAPSFHVWRFYDEDAIQKKLPGITRELVSQSGHAHRLMSEYYQSLVPCDVQYYIAPFSIKKGSSTHGIVFGSRNLRGLEKFLTECWKLDPTNGEANFGFDGDLPPSGQLTLLEEFSIPKKKQSFESYIKKCLKERAFTSSKEIYSNTLLKGFLPSHVSKILKQAHNEGLLRKVPKINYKNEEDIQYP